MKRIIPFIILYFIPLFISAQSIPSLDTSRDSKGQFKTHISLGGYFDSGNTEKETFSLKAGVANVDSIKEFSFDTKYLYGKTNHVLNQREFQAGLQFDYLPLSVFSPFARVEFYNNEFKKIDYRFSGMAGAKYRFYSYRKDNRTLSAYSISAAILIDSEHYVKQTALDSKEKVRLSIRPQFKQILTKNIYLQGVLFYKPDVSHWDDYLITGSLNLIFLINKHLSLSCSYDYDYNSKPATSDVKKTDTHLMFNLGISF
ncbi:DUF481 domain-containing protein [Bacteroidales bacterium OttesenSCG-928-M11]|nr:DUF481 domain-containing protein [Bacteroidales bacterium OttesenSCG-928-M11]